MHRFGSAKILALLCVILSTLTYSAASTTCAYALDAQTVPPVEGNPVASRFAQPIKPQQAAPSSVQASPLTPDAKTKSGQKFRISDVRIVGSTIYSSTQLSPITSRLVGKDVTLTDVRVTALAITAKYRRSGYILSQAIVPEQVLTNGVVEIRVVEGFIDHIVIKGGHHAERRMVESMMQPVLAAHPLRLKVLERARLAVETIPGVTARTVFSPSEKTPGASSLTVIVSRPAISAYIQFDNRGSKAIGPVQGFAEIDANSLLGRFDQTSLKIGATPSKELRYVSLSHTEPIGLDGLLLTVEGSYSKSQPKGNLNAFQVAGEAKSFGLGLSGPVALSTASKAVARIKFDVIDNSSVVGSTRLFNDKLRVLRVGFRDDTTDTLFGASLPAATVYDISLSNGLLGLGASKNGSPDLSRADARTDFTKVAFDIARTQALPNRFELALHIQGQAASSVLPASEQFALGGSGIGRGYEPSEVTGDHGIAASVELRYVPSLPRKVVSIAQVYAFAEAGEVWGYSAQPGLPITSKLASTGLGLRLDLPLGAKLTAEAAYPINHNVASQHNRDPQYFAVLSRSF